MENNINFEKAFSNNVSETYKMLNKMKSRRIVYKLIALFIILAFLTFLCYMLSSRKDVYAKSTNGDIVRVFSVEKTIKVGDTIYSKVGLPFVVMTDN